MTRTHVISASSSQASQLSNFRGRKAKLQKPATQIESLSTTRSGTPDSNSSDGFKFHGVQEQRDFLIDVKPKSKVFKNAEERKTFVEQYKMKLKTELCKNFELRGYCKFGDTCSFAHGKHELQEKKHLHEKYKTRPCKDFHQKGYCCYGQRCQYLHKEAIGVNIFYNSSSDNASNSERNNCSYELLDEIWKMSNSNIKVEKILEKIPERKRLPVFYAITASN